MVSKGLNAITTPKKSSGHRATLKKVSTTPKKITLCKPTPTKKRSSRITKQIAEDGWNDVVFFEAKISSEDQPEDASQYYT
jgi:hypothetical protein